jgi:hypothetical protein
MITNINEVADVTTEYRVSVFETCVAESDGLSGLRASLGIYNATSWTFIQYLRTVFVLNPIG